MAHNGTKFDFQLILRELDLPNLGHVYMIGDDSEGLKTMKFRGLHFIDSYSFLTMSLDKAVNELRLSGHDFPLLAQSKLYRGSLQREMLLKKGLFCYEHFSNYQEMAEQTTFPPLESFRSSLRAELPSRTEYDEALRVWHCFGCKTMLSYLRLYCCLDVVLLAESVMNFRYVNLFLKVDRGDDEINGSEGDFYISISEMSYMELRTSISRTFIQVSGLTGSDRRAKRIYVPHVVLILTGSRVRVRLERIELGFVSESI